MPQPGEAELTDIKLAPSSPSISLQLHQEFAVFRATLLTDVKSLLQAALQEVLDQHGVLIKNQETSIKQYLEEATGQVQAANDYYYADYGAETGAMQMVNYDVNVNTQPLILEGHDPLQTVPGYGAAVATPAAGGTAAPLVDAQHCRSRRAAHKKGENLKQQPSANIPRNLMPKAELPSSRIANSKMVLFGKSLRFLKDRTALDVDPYDVTSFYKTAGITQRIARSDIFNYVTLVMLFSNLVWIGVDADENSEKDTMALQVFEHLFCTFFVLEIVVRYAAFALKNDCLKDVWFQFDAGVTVMIIFESWFLPIVLLIINADKDRSDTFIRAVRLLRVVRIVRLMRTLPELCTMAKGMLSASWAVLSTFLMIGSLVYAFGIIMHCYLYNYEQDDVVIAKHWSSLPDSMLTLVVHGVFLDNLGEVTRHLLDGGHSTALFFFSIFVLLSGAVVMNMLIGILCEAVRNVSAAEKENTARSKVRNKVLRMLKTFDVDGSGDITKEQLIGVVCDPEVAALLRELEVDIPHLLETQDMLYEGDDQVLRIPQIMNAMLELRGDRTTTMQDLVNGHSFTRWAVNRQLDSQTTLLKTFMEQMVERLAWQLRPTGQSKGQLHTAASNQLLQSLSSWVSSKQS